MALFAVPAVGRVLTGDISSGMVFSNLRLLCTLGMEALLALAWVPYLRRRGWSVDHATSPLSAADPLWGFGLALVAYAAYALTFGLAAALSFPVAHWSAELAPHGAPSWWLVIAVALLNPIFEEFLYLGYAANVMRRHGFAAALAASVAVRVVLHLYQGPFAIISILPIGIVFSVYFLCTGRLWPVIAAHGVIDILALGTMAQHAP